MEEASIREIQELRMLMGSPRDPDGRVFAQLGDALRRAGELEEAYRVLQEGVEDHPHFTPGHLTLGWVAQELGNLHEARLRFARTLELDPENPYGLLGLGRILTLEGDETGPGLLAQARALHSRVDTSVPALPESQVRLFELPFVPLAGLAPGSRAEGTDHVFDGSQALPFMSLGELAPASHDLDEDGDLPFVSLAELRPDEPDASRHGGGEEPGAAPSGDLSPRRLGSSLSDVDGEEDSGDATPVTRTMAELLVRQGLTGRALEVYRQLQEEDPEDPELRRRISELLSMEGQAPAAEVGLSPGDPEAAALSPSDADEEPGVDDLHPSLAVTDPEPAAPSPYDWAEDGEDPMEPAPPGSSAGAYFGRLLAWTPGNPAREADEATSPEDRRDPAPDQS